MCGKDRLKQSGKKGGGEKFAIRDEIQKDQAVFGLLNRCPMSNGNVELEVLQDTAKEKGDMSLCSSFSRFLPGFLYLLNIPLLPVSIFKKFAPETLLVHFIDVTLLQSRHVLFKDLNAFTSKGVHQSGAIALNLWRVLESHNQQVQMATLGDLSPLQRSIICLQPSKILQGFVSDKLCLISNSYCNGLSPLLKWERCNDSHSNS